MVGNVRAFNPCWQQRMRKWDKADVSALNERETEILNRIKSQVANALGADVKVFDGTPQQTERGLRLFLTGFVDITEGSPFVISKQKLARFAENEEEYQQFMQNLSKMISNQINNNAALSPPQVTQEEENSIHQTKLNMLSARYAFWLEHEEESQEDVFYNEPTENLPFNESNRAQSRSVNFEHNGEKWTAIVNPDGIWIAPADWQSLEEFSQNTEALPEATLRELEYLSKMLKHIPPLNNSLTVTQNRSEENPNGITTDPPETPTLPPHDPKETLHATLYPIADAFAQISAEAADPKHAEAAFRRLITSNSVVLGSIHRLSGREEFSPGDSLEKVNNFVDTFFEKFRFYGFEDGFSVAFAKLTA